MRLKSIAIFAISRRRLVLVTALLFLIVSGAVGADAIEKLSSGGFNDPGSESVHADRQLRDTFGMAVPTLVLLVSADAPIGSPEVTAAGRELVDKLAHAQGVERVESFWTSDQLGTALQSKDGRKALIRAQLAGDDNELADRGRALAAQFGGTHGPLYVEATGYAVLLAETEDIAKHDLVKSEVIAIPLTFIALFLIFRGLVAALIPVGIGVLAIFGTTFVMRVLGEITDVSIFAINLASALGLALAIDYSLLIVERYREELQGCDRPEAILAALSTAGRTVVFSGATVALALSALAVFPMYFLRSFAYAGICVVAIAVVGAVVVLPAILAAVGPRIDALSFARQRKRVPPGTGRWHTIATVVMRRPVPIAIVSVGVLAVLAVPFASAKLMFPDDRNLPPSSAAASASHEIRTDFAQTENGTLVIFADRFDGSFTGAADDYEIRLSLVPGVTAVHGRDGTFQDGLRMAEPSSHEQAYFVRNGHARFTVETAVEPLSSQGEQLLRDVRAVPSPFTTAVTGLGPQTYDGKEAIVHRLPVALAIIVITTFVMLMWFTRSVFLPVKAIALTILSLTATFGALVFIFQDGHLRWLVGDFTITNSLNTLGPPLLFCVAFGLSMDYEVFMLSRIKEEYDRLGGDSAADNTAAVARRLESTGPIVTAAAVVMAIVFVSLATSGLTTVKSLGVGLAIAVLMDATIVRALLVPAFMRLAGRLNWWLPRRLQQREKVAAA
ncbi:MMPL family transporter [Mycobacterium sp. NPDC048908]|uniref:MMPL family transporter n=1 Tax=Mycobacterium sp. NPDC048908 TaxID=3364292 RepID=UPI00371665CF